MGSNRVKAISCSLEMSASASRWSLPTCLGRIDRQQMDVVSLSTSNLSPVDALRRVASLLGDTSPAIDKGSLLDSIELRLHDLARARRRAVILVDEAQCMPVATLDELRMLANLEVAGQFPLQCFFVGQSEFLVRAEPARAGAPTPAPDRCASRRAFEAGRAFRLRRASTAGGGLARPPRSSTLICSRSCTGRRRACRGRSTLCSAGCCSWARWSGGPTRRGGADHRSHRPEPRKPRSGKGVRIGQCLVLGRPRCTRCRQVRYPGSSGDRA